MIGAGDAAASLVSPSMYRQFALPYEQRVCQAIREAGSLVKLHVCGNTTKLLHDMAHCGADLYNVDHLVSLEQARDVYAAHGVCFKGNLDPVRQIMQATPDECRAVGPRGHRRGNGRRRPLHAERGLRDPGRDA